jgi:energy-coupling factor transport system ATP-binding protein
MATVRIDNVTFTYTGQVDPALRAVDLTIRAGDVVLLTGPSGCGKSTLAHALVGLIPTRITGTMHGRAYLDDAAVSDMKIHDVAQHIGIVFQNPDTQLVQLSVEEEVAFGPENLMLPAEEIEKRVVRALAATGMLAYRREQLFALSGGQKQRVAIAAVLAMQPQVLVLDEPTSDLDPVGTQEVLAVLRDLNSRDGTTIVLIEHKVDEVIGWVDRLLLMDQGRIVVDAPPRNAFAQRAIWHTLGVAIPQLVQVAQGLPEVFGETVALTVDAAYAALKNTPFAATLRRATAPAPAPLQPLTTPGPPLAEWRNVDLAFGTHQVLFNVSMHVQPGEWVALIGANGSGKTSLASLVMGFQGPTGGTIMVNGRPVKPGSVSRQATSIAYLFQAADTMLFTSSVERELQFGQTQRLAKKRDAAFTIDSILRVTDLEEYRETNPFLLSFGQRKRLAIGALLTRQPAMLILDEPTTGQDEGHARTFLHFLEEVRQRLHLTYLMITHDMRAVAMYATRLMVLREGQIALQGSPSLVFAHRAELATCGIVPPPIADLHARLCGDQAAEVALTVPDFLRMIRPSEVAI